MAAASVAVFVFGWAIHPLRSDEYPRLLYLLVFAQIMSTLTIRGPGGTGTLKGLALTAAGLASPGPGVVLVAWLSFHDGRRPDRWARDHQAAWTGSSGALAHGVASLVVTAVHGPVGFDLALRTPLYALVEITLEMLLSAAFVGFSSRRWSATMTSLLDFRHAAWGRGLVVLAGGLLVAALTNPSGYVLAPVLIGFAAAVRRNLSDSARLHSLWDQAHHDPLTGLLNRRGMNHEVERMLAGGRVRALAAIVLDLDHFKRLNDRYGHAAGDRALVALGSLIRGQIRSGDIAARIGGEEFVVVLSTVPVDRAVALAERLRAGVGSGSIFEYPLTLSAGVAVVPASVPFDQLLLGADEALYEAKLAGRDRVVHKPLDLPATRVRQEERRGRVG